MKFCTECYCESSSKENSCPTCGKDLKEINIDNSVDNFKMRPRFVFVYEMLPSSFSTIYMLALIFTVCYIGCNWFGYDPIYVVYIYGILFVLKAIKIFSREFKYRNISYNVNNIGIEYINDSKNQRLFLPYTDIKIICIQTNLATRLFGYGHILVRNETQGIYLDYVAEVNKLYDYINQHTNN